eukprot:7993486-Heterocapsa_arctica.AAC.1
MPRRLLTRRAAQQHTDSVGPSMTSQGQCHFSASSSGSSMDRSGLRTHHSKSNRLHAGSYTQAVSSHAGQPGL